MFVGSQNFLVLCGDSVNSKYYIDNKYLTYACVYVLGDINSWKGLHTKATKIGTPRTMMLPQ